MHTEKGMKVIWGMLLCLFCFTATAPLSAQKTRYGQTPESHAPAAPPATPQIPQAPIPDPILKGRRAFISFELSDVTPNPDLYSGGPERAYNELYMQMKQWAHYELVTDPSQADIIFAIRIILPAEISMNPELRLSVLDEKTGVSLWGFAEPVDFNSFQTKKARDAKFSAAVEQLVSNMQELLSSSPGNQ